MSGGFRWAFWLSATFWKWLAIFLGAGTVLAFVSYVWNSLMPDALCWLGEKGADRAGTLATILLFAGFLAFRVWQMLENRRLRALERELEEEIRKREMEEADRSAQERGDPDSEGLSHRNLREGAATVMALLEKKLDGSLLSTMQKRCMQKGFENLRAAEEKRREAMEAALKKEAEEEAARAAQAARTEDGGAEGRSAREAEPAVPAAGEAAEAGRGEAGERSEERLGEVREGPGRKLLRWFREGR
ncbi:MAG: hypothetical protein Q4F72_12260 [Desulfovibrionaceae bacterium]|nr:hypothetical protein [Desulfovibrionaceae bacterium]